MPEADYQEAVQVLIDQLGGQWQGLEEDGRDEMERVLRDKLGYDRTRARETIDTMVKTGILRYYPAAGLLDDDKEKSPVLPVGPLSTAGAIGLPSANVEGGYWQIGRETGEAAGRAGQVQAS